MPTANPLRGEVWYVNFDPQVGAETQKCRPALVVSVNGVGKLPLRIVVPITDWKAHYDQFPWFTKLEPRPSNGLSKASGADGFQTKSVSLNRFSHKSGQVTAHELKAVVACVALCIGAP